MDPLDGGGLDGLNITLNGTSPNGTLIAPSTILGFLQDSDFLLLELKLVGGALGIIYLGAHASLRRPPSALATTWKKKGRKQPDEVFTGLELVDAIIFPVMASIVLVGLYYLIQWLKDPAILNKILRYYMSTVSIVSVLTLYAHGIEVLTSFVFPRYWRGRDGFLRKVDQNNRTVAVCDDVGNRIEGSDAISSPLPGFLAWLAPSEALRRRAWDLRDLLTRRWTLKLTIHGVCNETARVRFAHMLALCLSMGTAISYFSTSSPFMSNVLSYGMCYATSLVLSPTNFLVGSMVLCGLFFYDIVMVFYTPYMITVATKLDVPIKLTYEAAARKSILGLGDIVVPAMLIGWSLRLDLWMYYLRKIKYESVDLKMVEKDAASGEVVTRSEIKHKEVKTPYVNAKGSWGERMWTRGPLFLSTPRALPADVEATKFQKTYFYASMFGYGLGMLCTLAMLLVFKRGQPALLYLVPGVLGSLILTSLARGEFKELCTYTEDGSLDKVDVVVELDGNGRAMQTIGELEDGVVDMTKKDKEQEEGMGKGKGKEKEKSQGDGDGKDIKKSHQVFLLSLVAGEDD